MIALSSRACQIHGIDQVIIAANAPRRYRRSILLGIVLVALALRLIHVAQPLVDTFSWRQASTGMMALNFYRGHWNIFMPQVDWTGPGPNYQGREFQSFSYATALIWNVVGQHDMVGRLLSILAGTWGVFAFFQLVRRVWDDDSALCAAAMLAIMPGAVFIDRSFLPDPTMLSLLITGFWLLLAWLQSAAPSRRLLAGSMVLLVLAFMTKLPALAAMVPIVYSVVWILKRRKMWTPPRLRVIGVIVSIALVPIVSYYAWAIYLGATYPPFHIAGARNLVWADGFWRWLEQGYFLDWGLHHATSWLWTWPTLMLALIGLLFFPPVTSEPGSLRPRRVFHFWLAGCAVLWIFAARELNENVWNMHIFNPPIAAFAGLALVRIGSTARREGRSLFGSPGAMLRIGVLLLVVLTTAQAALRPFYEEQAGQGRALGLALREISAPEDLVVVIANDVGDPIPIYYAARRGWVFPPAGNQANPNWNFIPQKTEQNIKAFEELRAKGARWFGIVADPRDDTPGREKFWENHSGFVNYLHNQSEAVVKSDKYVIYKIKAPEGTEVKAAE